MCNQQSWKYVPAATCGPRIYWALETVQVWFFSFFLGFAMVGFTASVLQHTPHMEGIQDGWRTWSFSSFCMKCSAFRAATELANPKKQSCKLLEYIITVKLWLLRVKEKSRKQSLQMKRHLPSSSCQLKELISYKGFCNEPQLKYSSWIAYLKLKSHCSKINTQFLCLSAILNVKASWLIWNKRFTFFMRNLSNSLHLKDF